KLNVESVLVQNGELAIKQYMLNPHAFQLVFMDCEMPICDGMVATRQIREFELQRGITPVPIIALTAHVLEGHRQGCLDAGANDVLTKPINLQQLQNAFERWLKSDLRNE
ncbi:MAG TPA: response regulator, partial [Pseudomonadales bacterium]|nr:response regulator [Pseudomonadales bacterium]